MSGQKPDYVADAKAFRARQPAVEKTIQGLVWNYIDTGPVSGGAAKRDDCLILCPGTLGNADVFRNLIDALSPEMRVISLTYPMSWNAPKMADGAVALARSLGVERAHILGSSLGGVMVQLISARHPDFVDHLFIANSLSRAEELQSAYPPEQQVRDTPGKLIKNVVTKSLAVWPEPAPEFAAIKTFLAHELKHSFTGRSFKARVMCMLMLDEIPRAATPLERTTVIDSDDDPLIPVAVRTGVRARYVGAHVHTFPEGGHFPYITRADSYIGLLKNRLSI